MENLEEAVSDNIMRSNSEFILLTFPSLSYTQLEVSCVLENEKNPNLLWTLRTNSVVH